MTEEKKSENIVKKVFERRGPRQERVSPLFTHYKNPQKTKAAKPSKTGDKDPQPRRLPVAIDFGGSRIKLLQLAQDSKGGLEVVLMDEEICMKDSTLNPLFQTKLALEKILSRNPVGPNVIVGLPAKETQTYNFAFPAMSEEDLREAVRWKIRQLKPFNLEEEKVRYAILRWETPIGPTAASGAQQRVTVVCVSADNLSQKSTVLNEVGLKPVSIHISPLGLVNVRRFRAASRNSEEVVLWLDLGAEESVFIVEKMGIVYFMRNLSVTGRQLTKQIAQSFRVTDEAAELLKRKHGLEAWKPDMPANVLSEEEKAKNPSAAVCYALVSTLENLVVDIEHSFKYFSYQVTQSQIPKFDRVVLSGGCANLKYIENFLSDRLAVPVEKVDPFAALRVQEALRNQRTSLAEDAMVFASAAGLAISLLVDKEMVINLLDSEKKKKAQDQWIQRIKTSPRLVGALAVMVAAVMIAQQVAPAVYLKKQADEAARQVKQAREELGRRQSNQLELAEEEKKLLEKKAMLEEKLSLFQQSSGRPGQFSKVLTKLASLMPEDIWVTKLSFSEKKLTLVGSTAKNESVVLFLENLKKPEEFSDVVFDYTQRDVSSSVFSFEIMMNVK